MNIFYINIIVYWKRINFKRTGILEIKKDNESYKLNYSGPDS